MRMELNLSQIKDLDYICQIAQPLDQHWIERIARYRSLFAAAIERLESRFSPTAQTAPPEE
jgi:hypothetical protein